MNTHLNEAPTERNISAQGNALGHESRINQALKGRHNITFQTIIAPPFQTASPFRIYSQGVALTWNIVSFSDLQTHA